MSPVPSPTSETVNYITTFFLKNVMNDRSSISFISRPTDIRLAFSLFLHHANPQHGGTSGTGPKSRSTASSSVKVDHQHSTAPCMVLSNPHILHEGKNAVDGITNVLNMYFTIRQINYISRLPTFSVCFYFSRLRIFVSFHDTVLWVVC